MMLIRKNFNVDDRKVLLDRGVGEVIIDRLERVGIASFSELKHQRCDDLIGRISLLLGSQYWRHLPSAYNAVALAIYLANIDNPQHSKIPRHLRA